MPSKTPKIVFLGTPEIAAYVLEKLLEDKYRIEAIVTSPDKPAGRGRQMRISEVKKVAMRHNLRVFQPENLKDPDFINELKATSPDIQIVVAFRKIPREIWQIPPLGTFNMHASLLPYYRGAAPINRVIMNGEKHTGVTTFLIDECIDTGKILLREKINIEPGETAGTLHDKIKVKGAELVIRTIDGLLNNDITPIEQENIKKEPENLKKAPKIYKEDCRINWAEPCHDIVNLIHGLSPVPGAYTELKINENKSLTIKIFKAVPEKYKHDYPTKKIITDNKTYLKITTPDGVVSIKELQISGKKRISIEEFLRGYRLTG